MMSGKRTHLAYGQFADLVELPASAGLRAIMSAFSDQFIALAPQLAEEEVALFDVVFMEIVRDTGIDDRVQLAERFARMPNAPAGLVGHLAQDDEIRVAGPILRGSPRVDHEALLAIAATKSQAHLEAIAVRQIIPPDICDVLAKRSTPAVLIVLVNNPGADFDIATKRLIVEKSFGHPDLFISVDRNTVFGKAVMLAYDTSGSGTIGGRDADSEVAGYIGHGQIDRALAVIAMEARTQHRVVTRAYQKDTLESFVIIARAANLSWGTMVGLLLNQFGIAVSASQINESRRLFDDTTRREALNTTGTLARAYRNLHG